VNIACAGARSDTATAMFRIVSEHVGVCSRHDFERASAQEIRRQDSMVVVGQRARMARMVAR